MNKLILYCFIFVLLISCGKSKATTPSSDDPGYFEREEKKKRDYFQTILNHPTRGLYQDFDIWALKPVDKITKVDSTLLLPVLEIVQDSAGFVTELIVHQKKGFSDTLFIDRNSKNPYFLHRVMQCPMYAYDLNIYLNKDSIVTIQSMQSGDTLNTLDIYSVSKRNESKVLVYNILKGYESTDHDTAFYIDPSLKNPIGYKPYYKSRIVEKIVDGDSISINLFFDEYRFTSDESEFKTGYMNTNVSSNAITKYLFNVQPYYYYCRADESTNNTFVKYRSYFWFMWNTKWSNIGFAANPDDGGQ